ncbi:hypothetical protein U3516DRAFT_664521 [Neocallimastix sp. 'constans']
MDNENYPQPKLIQLPYGNSIGQTLANKKYPKPVYSRQPCKRFSRHLRVLDIISISARAFTITLRKLFMADFDHQFQPEPSQLPYGNSLWQTLTSENYPQLRLVQILSRDSLKEIFSNEKYPQSKSATLGKFYYGRLSSVKIILSQD